jgi:hypothetical protein
MGKKLKERTQEEIENDLQDVASQIKARIQAYADKHNISFDEAKKRAKLTVGGREVNISEESE